MQGSNFSPLEFELKTGINLFSKEEKGTVSKFGSHISPPASCGYAILAPVYDIQIDIHKNLYKLMDMLDKNFNTLLNLGVEDFNIFIDINYDTICEIDIEFIIIEKIVKLNLGLCISCYHFPSDEKQCTEVDKIGLFYDHVTCELKGKNFDPFKFKLNTSNRLYSKRIDKSGCGSAFIRSFTNKIYPHNYNMMKVLKIIENNYDIIKLSSVKEMNLILYIYYESQCNLEFTYNQLKKIYDLGINFKLIAWGEESIND